MGLLGTGVFIITVFAYCIEIHKKLGKILKRITINYDKANKMSGKMKIREE